MPENLKAWIVKGLAQPGRTQRGLAKVLGVHPTRISRIASGEREMRPEEIAKTARYFGVPLDGAPEPSFEQGGCFDMPKDLQTAVRARAAVLQMEPEEFVLRAVHAALMMSASNETG